MSMKYLAIISYLFIISVKGQSVDNGLLEIQIANDSLQTFDRNPELTISLQCKNNSGKNLLLYGFDSNLITIGTADQLCGNQERVGGGIALLVFNEKHEREHAVHSIPDSIAYKPMPKERFEKLMEQGRVRYLAGTRVLKAYSTSCLDRKINLREYRPLKKGVYHLQIIYFAGKSLMTKRVGEEQIAKDKKEHNAELYQGCAISNTITFRVD
jgi:hypothetical protein